MASGKGIADVDVLNLLTDAGLTWRASSGGKHLASTTRSYANAASAELLGRYGLVRGCNSWDAIDGPHGIVSRAPRDTIQVFRQQRLHVR